LSDGDCLACKAAAPGGRIVDGERWIVEHCIGPLGVGTLIVKPRRHVLNVADLEANEAAELGPLLQRTAAVVRELAQPQQVYVCLWSHGPVHIHFVVQPATSDEPHGPRLQVALFDRGELPDPEAAAAFAERARALLH
jgi:diadenosine tetraphosphate (Ap4A) HIT family hydrolase